MRDPNSTLMRDPNSIWMRDSNSIAWPIMDIGGKRQSEG